VRSNAGTNRGGTKLLVSDDSDLVDLPTARASACNDASAVVALPSLTVASVSLPQPSCGRVAVQELTRLHATSTRCCTGEPFEIVRALALALGLALRYACTHLLGRCLSTTRDDLRFTRCGGVLALGEARRQVCAHLIGRCLSATRSDLHVDSCGNVVVRLFTSLVQRDSQLDQRRVAKAHMRIVSRAPSAATLHCAMRTSLVSSGRSTRL
jgi:hypothetical protein